MAYTFDKAKVERFLETIKETQKLTEVQIKFEFVSKEPKFFESRTDKEITESCFQTTFGAITFYFFEKDGFDKWVEVFVKAETEIEKQESILEHWFSVPDEFEFLKRNLR